MKLKKSGLMKQNKFEKLILDLRSLKFSKVFLRKIRDSGIDEIVRIYVEKSRDKPSKYNGLLVVDILPAYKVSKGHDFH